jgi:transposase
MAKHPAVAAHNSAHRSSGSQRRARADTEAFARRAGSPDHAYYEQAAARLGGNRACLAVVRKLLKRSYHTQRELGDQALEPA